MSSIETVDNISAANRLRPLGNYTVSSFSTNGSGTGAIFEVIIDPIGAASVAVITKGSGYATNDTITIAGVQLSQKHLGNGEDASLTFDVNEVS